jgi:hypothetical protein
MRGVSFLTLNVYELRDDVIQNRIKLIYIHVSCQLTSLGVSY